MRTEASPERRVRPSGADVRHRRRLQETAALISAALGLFFLLSLISYHPLDVASTAYADVAHDRANLGGRLGAWAAEYLLQTLGLSVFWIPVLWFLLAYRWAVESGPTAEWTWLGFLMTVLSTAGLIGLWLPTFRLTVQVGDDLLPVEMAGGGWLGQTLARYGREWVGPWGATAAGALGTLIGLSLVTSWPPGTVLRRCGQWVYAQGRLLWTAYRGHRQRRALERLHRPAGRTGIPGTPPQEASPRPAAVESPEPPMDVTPEDVPPVAIVEKKRPVLQAERAWRPKPTAEKPEPLPGPSGSEEIDELEREARRWYEQARQGRSGEDYVLPPYQMLAPAENHEGPSPKELAETARIIQAKLAEFDIEGEITRAISGPVVTTFEFRPAPGVKISRIQGLAEDLALALGTESVRIDRIVHESAIGIEVPNRQRSVIALREVVESEIFLHSRMPMTIALGQTVHGEPYVTSLLKMPHLLIAGATGSGKSVALNCIIVSLLLKHTPDEVRLVLIDPKHVELKLYNGIPHLLTPVITDAQKAAAALKWLTREMEERQRQLALFNVRNLLQYNQMVQTHRGRRLAQRLGLEHPKPLPFYIVIIDEFADLMAVSSREVEDSIQRLSQMARAVGIHLILATQRPSVDVITGVIKANFPCRIAFRVASSADSRTILDRAGAERLLGRGDMLFVPPESYRMVRLHGAYVSEAEIEKVVRFWQQQGGPQYSATQFERVLETQSASSTGDDADWNDPLYDEAVQIVLRTGKTSISYLQRAMRIGYNRAARLIEIMEHNGVLSPPDHQGQRKILVSPDVTPGDG